VIQELSLLQKKIISKNVTGNTQDYKHFCTYFINLPVEGILTVFPVLFHKAKAKPPSVFPSQR
jgi:hypothetical protein